MKTHPRCAFLAILFMFALPLAWAQTNIFPSSGNVGIGTVTPRSILDVNGTIYAGAIFSAALQADNGSYLARFQANAVEFHRAAANYIYCTNSAGFLMFGSGGRQADFVIAPSGNIGIGTDSPGNKLHVISTSANDGIIASNGTRWLRFMPGTVGNAAFNNLVQANDNAIIFSGGALGTGALTIAPWASGTSGIRINGSGNVGIGTPSPGASTKLQVAGMGLFTGGVINPGDGTPAGVEIGYDTNNNYGFIQAVQTYVAWKNLAINPGGGNVGIGTTNPTEKLAVNGRIRAKEVIVETTGWTDYVFDSDYRLAPLSEIEQQIKAEKHLPGIPSAQEVAQGGISLGDMQARLLQKIEELTLHAIAQEKQLSAQQDEIRTLKAEIARLSTRN
jgi:hypothetical protein